MGKALEMARCGEFDVFIAREIDRLSRNLAKQLAVEAEFKRHDVAVKYVLGDFPDTPEGRLNKNIRATIAEFEREEINIRMTRARRNKVKDGSVMTHGRSPYGYRLVATHKVKDGKELTDRNFKLEVYEPEARIVRLIYEWYAVQRASQSEIRRRLAAMCIPTKAETGGDAIREGAQGYRKQRGTCQWATSSIHKILANETYAGVWHYSKRSGILDQLEVCVPPTIDRALWEQAQRVKAGNKANMSRETKFEYLMRGQLICGHCGARMTMTPNHAHGKTYLYYHCQAKARYARECSLGARTFSALEVDAAIWAWVRGLLSHPELVEEGFATYEAARESEDAPRRERGDFERSLLTERKQRLESTVAALEKERGAMAERMAAVSMPAQQKLDIRRFTEQAAKGLEAADHDFKARRRLVELLDVTASDPGLRERREGGLCALHPGGAHV